MALGNEKEYKTQIDDLKNFDKTKKCISKADLLIVNSTSRCSYELELIEFILTLKKPYVKVEYDYNFCIRRNILCTVDRAVQSCCNTDKFHLYRTLFAHSKLNIFQSPKHYAAHFEFYGQAVANHLIMPPTVQIDHCRVLK